MLIPMTTPYPPDFLDNLEAVSHYLGGIKAFLAGGALRDNFCGKPVKDLDIFVPYFEGVDEAVEDAMANQEYLSGTPGGAAYGNMQDIYFQSSYRCEDGVELNIIIMGDPDLTLEQVVTCVDFGICQIGMGLDGIVHCTQMFIEDARFNTFTMTRSPAPPVADPDDFLGPFEDHDTAQARARSLRRFIRLTGEKYPGWALRYLT